MDRTIRIFRHLEQVFEPYRIMFKELKERKSSSHRSVSARKREALKKKYQNIIFGDGQRFSGFRFSWGVLEPKPRQNEEWMYSDAAGCWAVYCTSWWKTSHKDEKVHLST